MSEATVAAALLSAAPSTLMAWRRHRAIGPTIDDVLRATRAAGTLLPPATLLPAGTLLTPGEGGLVRGGLAHLVVSALCGELLAHGLPARRSALWGAAAGLGVGAFNLLVVGRRFPQITALPLVPQLADNVAFGMIFALVADRQARSASA